MDLSPSSGAGVLSGTPVSYTFSVTNRDGSGCAASTFDLTSTVPSGWAASFSSSALSLASGASGTATLQVTSSASSSNGSYTVSAKAKNRGATGYSKSDTATYVVANPICARANPVLSISPSPSVGVAAGTPVTFDVSLTNNDSAPCVAATFDLTRTMPSGWTAVYGAPSLILSPGATGQTTLLVTSPASAADGSYSVTATAKNHAATSYSSSGVATYVVLNAGPTALADDFNRPDSTNLGTAWNEGAGDLVVSGGKLKNGPGVVNDLTAVAAGVNGETQSVEADFTSVDNNLGPRFGVMLRYVDSGNYYLIYRQTGGSSRLLISRFVNGVETILKTGSISNPAKDVAFHIKGRATGTTLSLDFNGVNKVTITDATFTTGKVGILIGNSSDAVQQEADNFNATAE